MVLFPVTLSESYLKIKAVDILLAQDRRGILFFGMPVQIQSNAINVNICAKRLTQKFCTADPFQTVQETTACVCAAQQKCTHSSRCRRRHSTDPVAVLLVHDNTTSPPGWQQNTTTFQFGSNIFVQFDSQKRINFRLDSALSCNSPYILATKSNSARSTMPFVESDIVDCRQLIQLCRKAVERQLKWIFMSHVMISSLLTSFRLCGPSVQTGDKVEFNSLSRRTLSPKLNLFNSVDLVKNGWFLLPERRTSFGHSVDFAKSDKVKCVNFNKINCVEFHFFASVNRAKVLQRMSIVLTKSTTEQWVLSTTSLLYQLQLYIVYHQETSSVLSGITTEYGHGRIGRTNRKRILFQKQDDSSKKNWNWHYNIPYYINEPIFSRPF